MISLIEALNAGRRPFVRAAQLPAEAKVIQGDFRPQVIGPDGRETGDWAAEIGAALKDKDLFVRAGDVWEFDRKRRALIAMRPERFCTWVEKYVALRKWAKGDGDESELVPSPMGVPSAVKVLASQQFHDQLREIERVSMVPLPVWNDDRTGGELLPVGYSAKHKTLVTEAVEFDETMTAGEAIEFLTKQLLAEFPLHKDDYWRSMAAILSMMLAPFCELLVKKGEQRPAFVVTANAERSGKTLLVRLALAPIFGPVRMTPPPTSTQSESLEKKLSSLAFAGSPYVFFDNWRGLIESEALEMFITSNVIEDRVLQKSEIRSAEKNTLVFITGNRAEVNDDMRGRSISINLFVQEAEPERRKVDHWMDENGILDQRAKILSALWAITKDWLSDGQRQPSSVMHGTFQRWGDVVGAIVERQGLPSPLSPPRLRFGMNRDLEAFEVLLPCVLDEIGADTRLLASAELMARARQLGEFSFLHEIEPEPATKEFRSERGTWGKVIERWMGRRFRSGCIMGWTEGSRQHRKVKIDRHINAGDRNIKVGDRI